MASCSVESSRELGAFPGTGTGWLRVLCAPLALILACNDYSVQRPIVAGSSSEAQALAPRNETGTVRIELLDPELSPPVFVQRGHAGQHRFVFLHGMCGHALGYAQSFQFAAAEKGRLIAPQADVTCGKGPWSKWSNDIQALDARILAAFVALGSTPPVTGMTVIGYSQGATRARELARKYPERYTRLILIGAPSKTTAEGLGHLRSTVMMAGERDRQDLMKASAQSLSKAGIPSTFMVLPGARHGAMGENPEKTMRSALDWLFEHSRAPGSLE